MEENTLKDRLVASAFAFRGYNTTNLGRTPELLEDPRYGRVMERHLREASTIAADATGKTIDLVTRVRQRRESTIDTFGEDIALIMSSSLAHLEMLRELGIEYSRARVGVGYSLGELTALIASGVHRFEDVLPPLLALADDCSELAHDTTMGVVFSRGPAIDLKVLHRLCAVISAEARGVIDISAYLSPNTVLVLGQGQTVDRFKEMLAAEHPEIHLRKNSERWPPLHTPLLWQRSVPNRAAQLMYKMSGGFVEPKPPVLSLVTGKISYNDYNSRETITQWLDHPQRLWDAVYEILSMGIETMVHIGPTPNLIPATFKRLSDNVMAQITGPGLNRLSMRAVQRMANRPWLSRMVSNRVALLRAPFVTHVIAEDWLLERGTAAGQRGPTSGAEDQSLRAGESLPPAASA